MVRTPPENCVLCHSRAGAARCGFGLRAGGRIGPHVASHVFRRGEYLFVAGTPSHSVFVLRAGCVKVFRTTLDGGEQVLRLLGPGAMLGYRPVLANEPYAASAQVVDNATLCILPAAIVREAVRDVPELAADLLARMAVELRLSEELMMDLVHSPVRQRAARLLLSLLVKEPHSLPPLRLRPRHMRRQDMARMIGTTPETFSRVLRGFAQTGLIDLTRAHLDIRDEDRLRRVAGPV